MEPVIVATSHPEAAEAISSCLPDPLIVKDSNGWESLCEGPPRAEILFIDVEYLLGERLELDPKEWKLAHCVSADVTATKNMNKGIAKIFRQKYPEMGEYIEKRVNIGTAVRFEKEGNVIYNLIPKEKVGQKAKSNYQNKYYQQLQ